MQSWLDKIGEELSRLWEWLSLESGPLLVLDIVIVVGLFYWLYTLIRGTRATRILVGLFVVEILLLTARLAELQILSWVMSKAFTVLLFAIPVIFQPELRRALGKIGEGGFKTSLRRPRKPSYSTVTEIVRACETMAEERVGAILIIKRRSGLEVIVESGTLVGARVSAKLLRSIFAPLSDLHDGAVVIEEDRIVAAGCFYVSDLSDPQIIKWGARHRAAVGFSLESDALVISISQERGSISLAQDGQVVEGVTLEELEEALTGIGRARPLPERGTRRKAPNHVSNR